MIWTRSRISTFLDRFAGQILILPALIFYIPLVIVPIIATMYFVFFKWSGTGLNTLEFIGLQNFVELAQDRVFWTALRNNFTFGISIVAGQIALALILAILLTQRRPFSQVFQVIYILPLTLSFLVVSVLANLLFSPSFDVMNDILRQIGLSFLANKWHADFRTAPLVIIMVSVWKSFGFALLIFVARIKSLPESLYEAATVDGANDFQQSWYITLPLLRPIILMVMMLEIINAFRMFDVVFALTEGGPFNATQVLATYAYANGFYYGRMGYSTTISAVLLLVSAVVTGAQLWFLRRTDRYEF